MNIPFVYKSNLFTSDLRHLRFIITLCILRINNEQGNGKLNELANNKIVLPHTRLTDDSEKLERMVKMKGKFSN